MGRNRGRYLGLRRQAKDEVEVTQYLRPNGKKRTIMCQVGKDHVEKSKNMILEAEVLPGNMVCFWVRFKDEEEELQFLDITYNGPGDRCPENILKELIDRKYATRQPQDGTKSD